MDESNAEYNDAQDDAALGRIRELITEVGDPCKIRHLTPGLLL
jgi:hypothetical protein